MIVYNPGDGSGGGPIEPGDFTECPPIYAFAPNSGPLPDWQANYYYRAGASVKSTDPKLGLVFVCLREGLSQSVEPVWPTVPYREYNGKPLEGYIQESQVDAQGLEVYHLAPSGTVLASMNGLNITATPVPATTPDGFELAHYGLNINYLGTANEQSLLSFVADRVNGFADFPFTATAQYGGLAFGWRLRLDAKNNQNSYAISFTVPSDLETDFKLTTVGGPLWGAVSSVYETLSEISPSSVVELFELHLDIDKHGTNQVLYFTNTKAPLSSGVIWGGQLYTAYPMTAEGFEWNGTGTLPRPTVKVSNHFRVITQLMAQVNQTTPGNDLNGAKFVRRRTLAKYLDAANFFPDGIVTSSSEYYQLGWGLSPNPDIEFPADIYFIDRLTAETRDVVEFELAASMDLHGIRAPKRQCISNICQWVYRGDGCGYTGPPVASADDEPLSLTTSDGFSSYAQAYYEAEEQLRLAKEALDAAREALKDSTNAYNEENNDWTKQGEIYDLEKGSYVEVDNYGNVAAYKNSVEVPLGGQYRKGELREDIPETEEDEDEFYRPGRQRHAIDVYSATTWRYVSQTADNSNYVIVSANGSEKAYRHGLEVELGTNYRKGSFWYAAQEFYNNRGDDDDYDDDD